MVPRFPLRPTHCLYRVRFFLRKLGLGLAPEEVRDGRNGRTRAPLPAPPARRQHAPPAAGGPGSLATPHPPRRAPGVVSKPGVVTSAPTPGRAPTSFDHPQRANEARAGPGDRRSPGIPPFGPRGDGAAPRTSPGTRWPWGGPLDPDRRRRDDEIPDDGAGRPDSWGGPGERWRAPCGTRRATSRTRPGRAPLRR